jgi:hypothetical protein
MLIESIKCKHGMIIECPDAPEMCCTLCAMEVFEEYNLMGGIGLDASSCIRD